MQKAASLKEDPAAFISGWCIQPRRGFSRTYMGRKYFLSEEDAAGCAMGSIQPRMVLTKRQMDGWSRQPNRQPG